MNTKLLLRWMPSPHFRSYDILTVYRIERNRHGVLVYRIVERVESVKARPELNDTTWYVVGSHCAHNRPATDGDLRRAAGFDLHTPEGIARDWWDEHVPPTHEQWQRGQRRAERKPQVPA